ncbi:MAG: FliM/FliN family flagellar motor switch protein [Planctomycetaceae bacterium]|nr:FliM/FliN family flagellar motor switch protein [Planctomycetaceae bacterium]
MTTLQRLESRLKAAASELTTVIGERLAAASDGPIEVEYLGVAPGARLPQDSGEVGTWVLQGVRRRDSGRIAIDQPLAVGLIDALLGGTAAASATSADRQLTGLEWSLLTRAVEFVAAVLMPSGNGEDPAVLETARESINVHGETVLATTTGPPVRTVLAGYQWKLPDCRGLVHFELSAGLVERLTEPMGSNDSVLDEATLSQTSTLVARLPTCGLATSDLGELCVGDVIVTGQPVADGPGSEWEVLVDGKPRFAGEPGSIDGRRAVVLSQPDGV